MLNTTQLNKPTTMPQDMNEIIACVQETTN